jgi:hypothetical protein
MKRLVVTLALSLILAATGCPLGPFSGGRLDGEVHSAAVSDWSFVAEHETCQLETNPEDPHSVNTWCMGYGEHLYIPTSMILGPPAPTEREWVKNVQADPHVRVRIGSTVYELTAVRVEDEALLESVLVLLETKHELRDSDREIWLYRMQAR